MLHALGTEQVAQIPNGSPPDDRTGASWRHAAAATQKLLNLLSPAGSGGGGPAWLPQKFDRPPNDPGVRRHPAKLDCLRGPDHLCRVGRDRESLKRVVRRGR